MENIAGENIRFCIFHGAKRFFNVDVGIVSRSRQKTLPGRNAGPSILILILRLRYTLLRHRNFTGARPAGYERLRWFHHIAETVSPEALVEVRDY